MDNKNIIMLEKLIKPLFFTSLILLFIGIFWLLISTGSIIGYIIFGLSLILLIFLGIYKKHFLLESLKKIQWQTLGSKSYYIIVLICILILINVIANKRFLRWDITENKKFTLSEHTMKLLNQLNDDKKDIKIIFFRSPISVLDTVDDLLKEYKARCSVISVEIVDPDREPQRVKQYNITSIVNPYDRSNNEKIFGTIIILSSGLKEKVDTMKMDFRVVGQNARPYLAIKDNLEREISSSLLRLTKAKKKVYFVSGHGEVDLDDQDNVAGWYNIKNIIADENYIIDKLYLATIVTIPDDCDVLILAAPEKILSPEEINVLNKYLDAGGHMLVLNDPFLKNNLNLFLNHWGIKVFDKMIIDKGSSYFFQADVPLIREYNQHPITEKLKYQTFFPDASPVEILDKKPQGVYIQPIAKSSSDSWIVMNANRKKITFTPGLDKKGPIDIIVALNEKINNEKEMKMVVIGNTSFVANTICKGNSGGSMGNVDFLLNTINWLAGKEELISIRSKPIERHEIALSTIRLKFIFYSCVVILPLLIIIAGVIVWLRRR